jgi:hypothetical protein
MNENLKNLIYLYCITPKEIKNLSDLYSIHYQGLYPVRNTAGTIQQIKISNGVYAIVSKVKESEFAEENLKKNLQDLEWVKEKATAHEKVIEGIMKQACVIPFKFGILFNNENNLRAMLKEHLGEFKTTLKYLEGKEEWGVKIYVNLEKLKKNLLQETEELLNIDKEISASSPGKAFLVKKKKEELLNTLVNKKINEYGQKTFDSLKNQSFQARINKLLPKEVTERNDDMILNSAFLIVKNRVNDFINTVESLKVKYTSTGLFFDCTGPWPPYNFCSIKDVEMIKK